MRALQEALGLMVQYGKNVCKNDPRIKLYCAVRYTCTTKRTTLQNSMRFNFFFLSLSLLNSRRPFRVDATAKSFESDYEI